MDYQERLIQHIFTSTKQSDNSDDQKNEYAKHPALKVYHNNYIENGIRALSIAFPTVFGIMDNSDFRRLAHDYLIERPKTCFDWADYGADFATFMFEIDALAEMPFLPELAELDWRLMHIEREPDKTFDAASFALLQTQAPNNLQFQTSPGLQFMSVIFPVLELHALIHDKALNREDLASKKMRSQHLKNLTNLINIAINSGEYRSIVLWRKDYKGLIEYIEGRSLAAFELLLAGSDIASVLATFKDDQAAMTAWLQAHIETKKIYAIVHKSE